MPYRERSRQNLRRTPRSTRCTECGEHVDPDTLMAKRVVWTRIGRKTEIRMRTIAHVCEKCANDDPDWNRKPHVDSPSFADVRDNDGT